MFNECIWKSDEKLLSFASLISPCKIFFFFLRSNIKYSTVFHHQIKHLEVHQKFSAAGRIFNSLLGVSSGDETLRLMLDILHHTYIRGVQLVEAWEGWCHRGRTR